MILPKVKMKSFQNIMSTNIFYVFRGSMREVKKIPEIRVSQVPVRVIEKKLNGTWWRGYSSCSRR
jgi:hypothetical protein